jgi:hypothetical protein
MTHIEDSMHECVEKVLYLVVLLLGHRHPCFFLVHSHFFFFSMAMTYPLYSYDYNSAQQKQWELLLLVLVAMLLK